MALIAGLGAGLYLMRDRFAVPETGGPAGPATVVKTAVATQGALERTIRLTGSSQAERYVSIVAPQMRGGRGGGVTVTQSGRGMTVMITSGGGGGGGGGGDSGRGGSGGGSSSGSSSSSSSAASSSMASAGGGSASGAGGSSGMGSAGGSSSLRSTGSNRFGGGSTASASSSARSSSSSAASAASSGGGSGGGGGGGGGGDMGMMSGGMSDFMQVLQKAAKGGSMVKKGDIVAEFDRQYQDLRMDDYKSTVEQGERNMRKLDVELEVTREAHEFSIAQARAAVEKAKLDIKTIPVRSQLDSEVLKLQLEEAEAQLKQLLTEVPYKRASEASQKKQAELDLEQSRQELKRAQRNIDRMVMTAPMDGMVVMQNMFRGGEFVQFREGDQLFPGQMFMQIVDPSSMLVAAVVNQADVEKIRVGAKAHLHFDAYPGLTLPGRVKSIGAMTRPGGQRSDFVKEVPVYIKIEKMDPRVIPDLSVSVDVVVEAESDRVTVPAESVFRDSKEGKPYVYVKTATGFQKREVEIGLVNHVRVAVVSGLKPGEVVALQKPPEEKPGGKQKDDQKTRGASNV